MRTNFTSKGRESVRTRKEIFTDETGAHFTIATVLSIPLVLIFVGLIFDYITVNTARRQVENTINHSIISGAQYIYRSQGTIQPNCAMGASLTAYSANRKQASKIVRNTSFIDNGGPVQSGEQLYKKNLSPASAPQFSDNSPKFTGIDATTSQLQAQYGFTHNQPMACDYSSIPLSQSPQKDKLSGRGHLFDTSKGIRILPGDVITSTQDSAFYVDRFDVASAKYENGKLVKPSRIRMCVTELVQRPFIGRIIPKYMFTPVTACGEGALRLSLQTQ